MFALTLIIHIFVGSTVAGSAVIAALTMGYDTMVPIIAAAAIGFVASFPLSWYVARQIRAL